MRTTNQPRFHFPKVPLLAIAAYSTMCNPSSSAIANRRRLVVALPPGMEAAVSKPSSVIPKNSLGPMFRNHTAVSTVQPSTGATVETVENTVPAPTSSSNSSSNNSSSYLPSLYSPSAPHPYFQEEPVQPKPKRRRKPQKPGKTAKQNDRHFVVHNYHDHAHDEDHETDDDQQEEGQHRGKGGVAISFPLKLHAVLDQVEADGLASIISWRPHGRCFLIHKPKEFVDNVMPNYFRQTKLTSFQRQLNLYVR